VNEEKRGIFPGKRQTIDFCGFFSPHSVPSQKEKERRNTRPIQKEKTRTRKLRPHLVVHAEEEDVEEDAEEEETLVATRLAKCLSMVFFFFWGKFLIREKLCVLSFRVFYLFFTVLCFLCLAKALSFLSRASS